jgi:hypothetical protein
LVEIQSVCRSLVNQDVHPVVGALGGGDKEPQDQGRHRGDESGAQFDAVDRFLAEVTGWEKGLEDESGYCSAEDAEEGNRSYLDGIHGESLSMKGRGGGREVSKPLFGRFFSPGSRRAGFSPDAPYLVIP